MKLKKLLAGILSVSMLATATAALAAAPSAYDGQAYGSLGYTSDDEDGQFNLAVIANSDVNIYGDTMYIQGSVYSNGTIYIGNGQGNKIDGLLISDTGDTTFASDTNNDEWTQYRTAEGYVHVDDYGKTDDINYYSTGPEYYGAINDTDTSFDCTYTDFEIPEIENDLGDVEMNVYGWDNSQWGGANTAARTISEDTKYGSVKMNGSYGPALTIDTTNGDVNVVIDEITSDSVNINIKVVGDNDAYIYIGKLPAGISTMINYDNTQWPMVESGQADKTHLYVSSDTKITASRIILSDINVNADSFEISGDTKFTTTKGGDAIVTKASSLTLSGGETEVFGTICAPNAASQVVNSATLYGQLHTDTLTINGAGRIIWAADSAVAKTETEPTEAPEATPTPEPQPTDTPEPIPTGKPIDLSGVGYAYVFGYEPAIHRVDTYDEEGNVTGGEWIAEVQMAPDDAVTREQVAAMIMRLLDQKYDTKSAEYPLTDNIAQHAGTWYERGLAYLAGKGTFDGIDSVETGAVTRGEVAKLVAYGLNLSDTVDTEFTDIADSKYKAYIEIMAAYGYMNGVSDNTFEPNRVMTRAEFCKMFNNIIGREDMGLEAEDGTVVTPALYSIVDLSGHWAESTMLKATSAYDDNGYVDITTRLSNIRNILDKYDSQTWF
jgi:hypothetical protein